MAATSLLFQLLWPLLLGPLLSDVPACAFGSLNLEELNEMRYGIEILPRPVIGGQSQSSEVVIVSSKYKQRYECRLPAGAIHFQREHEEDAPPYKGPGVPELLNPMRDAPCLVKTKDWWTYEFCYGRHIQQYHMEGPAPEPVDGFHDNVQVKVIRNPGDLVRFIEELKGGTKKGKLNPGQEGDAESNSETAHEGPEVKADGVEEERIEEEEADEEERLLGEFEKELEGMLLPSDRGRLRFEVKTGMEKELDNIIQEAESELDPEEPRSATERSQASQALASTLNKLIQRMDGRQGPDQGEGPMEGGATPNQPSSPQSTGKVEIKIVRPGAGESEEEDGHWLSDEDTKNLKEIFFNILIQGAEEAQKERQRQRQLESNYRRVWGPQGEEGTGDHEEFDF
uniref:Endoplasmic reticulum lectin n=1 Tax=Monodelphis domestica TaxID=13616 RepID=A0A5F8HGC1_MONDO